MHAPIGTASRKLLSAKLYPLFVLAVYLINLRMFFPGMLSYDTSWQIDEALSGVIGNQHPPLMAWWWGVMMSVVDHYGVMLVFNLTAFHLGLFLLGRYMHRSNPLLAYLMVALLYTPSLLAINNVLWKDTGMASMLLLGFGIIVTNERLRASGAIWLLPVFFYAVAIRHNGFIALPPLLLLAAARLLPAGKNWHRVLLAVCAWVGIFTAAHLVNDALTVKRTNTAEWFMLVETAHISRDSNHQYIPDSVLKHMGTTYEEFMTKNYLGDEYNLIYHKMFYAADPGFMELFTPEERRDLTKAFLRAIAEQPGIYLAYRARAAGRILAWNYDPYYPFEWGGGPYPAYKAWIGTYMKGAWKAWFKGWPYFGGGCILFGLLLIDWWRGKRSVMPALALITSGLIYQSANFFLTGADFRYNYWLVVTCHFTFGLYVTYHWAHIKALGNKLLPKRKVFSPEI